MTPTAAELNYVLTLLANSPEGLEAFKKEFGHDIERAEKFIKLCNETAPLIDKINCILFTIDYQLTTGEYRHDTATIMYYESATTKENVMQEVCENPAQLLTNDKKNVKKIGGLVAYCDGEISVLYYDPEH